jgi:hypothetical protein
MPGSLLESMGWSFLASAEGFRVPPRSRARQSPWGLLQQRGEIVYSASLGPAPGRIDLQPTAALETLFRDFSAIGRDGGRANIPAFHSTT